MTTHADIAPIGPAGGNGPSLTLKPQASWEIPAAHVQSSYHSCTMFTWRKLHHHASCILRWCLSHSHQTCSIDFLEVSCYIYCNCIQFELSSPFWSLSRLDATVWHSLLNWAKVQYIPVDKNRMRSFQICGKRSSIHTLVCNAVSLVWGLLRLAPTTNYVTPIFCISGYNNDTFSNVFCWCLKRGKDPLGNITIAWLQKIKPWHSIGQLFMPGHRNLSSSLRERKSVIRWLAIGKLVWLVTWMTA